MLPPAVAGIGLLVAFGRFGLLGSTFDWLGINVSFNQTAVVFAITLVAGPFYIRQAIASFEAVDTNLVAASRTLGAGPAAHLLPRRAAARPRRARGGRGDLPGARAGRVRRDDHVRRQPAGEDGDASARDLHGVRGLGGGLTVPLAISALLVVAQPGDPPLPQAQRFYGSPQGSVHSPPSVVSARARARGRGDGRARRAVGRRQDLGAARRRGARAPAERPDRARRRDLVRLASRGSSASPTSGGWGSSSRSTRSSRT